MGIKPAHPRRRKSDMRKIEEEKLLYRLKVLAFVAIVFGLAAAVAVNWDRWFAPPVEKVVTIYGLHTCACAFSWGKSLENSGYTVRLYEPGDLRIPRADVHAPPNSQGCHIARYVDYFLEGDVPAEVLQRLAAERPSARGVLMESHATQVTAGTDAHEIYLVDAGGAPRRWFTWMHRRVEDKVSI